jgi:hypothetical protein
MLLGPFVSNTALPNSEILPADLEVISDIVLSAVSNRGT